jgi:hypothetical protein
LKGFILACNRFAAYDRVNIPNATKCFLEKATDYYWRLMEELCAEVGNGMKG